MNLSDQILKLHKYTRTDYIDLLKKYGYQATKLIGIALYSGYKSNSFFFKYINERGQLRFAQMKFDEHGELVPTNWKKEEFSASKAMEIFQKLVPSAKSGNAAFKIMLVYGSSK